MTTSYTSPTRNIKYLDMSIWSAALMPMHGPTWYSHCPGMTSAFTPLMVTPEARQSLRCASTTSRPKDTSAPTAQ